MFRPPAETFSAAKPTTEPTRVIASEAATQRFLRKVSVLPDSRSSHRGSSAMAMRPRLLMIILTMMPLNSLSLTTPPALENTRAGRIKLK